MQNLILIKGSLNSW